jgi:hypothetical protein
MAPSTRSLPNSVTQAHYRQFHDPGVTTDDDAPMYLVCFSNPAMLPETWHTHRTFENLEAASACAASLETVRLVTRVYQCHVVEASSALEAAEARAA